MNKENISIEHLLVIVDDLSLPLGSFTTKTEQEQWRAQWSRKYRICYRHSAMRPSACRYRQTNFHRGGQIDWVMAKYDDDDLAILKPNIDTAVDIIKSFVPTGI